MGGFCQADILRRKVSNSPERLTCRIAWSDCVDPPLARRIQEEVNHAKGVSNSQNKDWQPTDRVFENAAHEAQNKLQTTSICQEDAVNFQSQVLEAQYRRLSGVGDVSLFGTPSLEVRVLQDPVASRFSSNPAEWPHYST